MPKYTVGEVLEIIEGLTDEEKLELKHQLPRVLGAESIPPAFHASQDSSQAIRGINISGSSNVEVSQSQTNSGSSMSQSGFSSELKNGSLQDAFSCLDALKQDIDRNEHLNLVDKQVVSIPIQIVTEELKKSKPDKGLVDQALETLKKGLKGAQELAEPVATLSKIIAKAWIVLL